MVKMCPPLPVLRTPDGPAHRRGQSGTPRDGPENSSGRYGRTQDSQRPRTFKPRRPEIDTVTVFDKLAPPTQDRLSAAQSGHQAQAQQECRSTRPQRPTNPAGGHVPAATERTTKKDVIKIGTVDIVI
jgi:hypothetical protein